MIAVMTRRQSIVSLDGGCRSIPEPRKTSTVFLIPFLTVLSAHVPSWFSLSPFLVLVTYPSVTSEITHFSVTALLRGVRFWTDNWVLSDASQTRWRAGCRGKSRAVRARRCANSVMVTRRLRQVISFFRQICIGIFYIAIVRLYRCDRMCMCMSTSHAVV